MKLLIKLFVIFTFFFGYYISFGQDINIKKDYKLLLSAADSLSLIRNYDKSNKLAYEAIKIINSTNKDDLNSICNAYSVLVNNYLDLGEYEKAITHSDKGISFASKIQDYNFLGLFNSDKSIAYFVLGRYNDAINTVKLSLEFNKKNNNEEGISNSLNTMGKIYEVWKQYDNAISAYKESLSYLINKNNLSKIAIRLSGIASTYRLKGDLDSALLYQTQALEIELRTKNKYKIAVRYDLLGEIYQDKKQYNVAEDYFLKALKLLKESEAQNEGDNQIMLSYTIILNHLGKINKLKNNLNESIKYYNQSLEIAYSIKYQLMILKTTKELAEVYNKNGNYKKAYELLQEFVKVKEIVFEEQSQKTIADFQKKYEAEKKDNEIQTLQKSHKLTEISLKQVSQARIIFILISITFILISVIIYIKFYYKKVNNEKLAMKNLELEDLNKQKDRFFSIISHDLRSPISSFLRITESVDKSFEKYDKDTLKSFIKSMNETAIELNIFLQNLLEWAMSNLGKLKTNKIEVDLNSECEQIIDFNSNLAKDKNIKFEKRFTDNIKAFADLEMFKTAFRNLITNAIKYGDANSTVKVSTTYKDKMVKISVRNTCLGGICTEELKRLNLQFDGSESKHNYSNNGGTGMGLDISLELMKLNNGKIILESAESDNITFSILLPNKDLFREN